MEEQELQQEALTQDTLAANVPPAADVLDRGADCEDDARARLDGYRRNGERAGSDADLCSDGYSGDGGNAGG